MNRIASILLIASTAIVSMVAVAQDAKPAAEKAASKPKAPATVAAPAASAAVVTPAKVEPAKVEAVLAAPKHKCAQPVALEKISSDTEQKNFVKEVDAYRDCLIAFRNDMNKLAKAHVDAGNAAVEEFNTYVASLNKK
jgi:nucleoid-associated protein YgaU